MQCLRDFVERCIEEANEHRIKHIAFSTLGIGFLKFPADKAASIMVDTLKRFDRRRFTSLSMSVSIVIFDGGDDRKEVLKVNTVYCRGCFYNNNRSYQAMILLSSNTVVPPPSIYLRFVET